MVRERSKQPGWEDVLLPPGTQRGNDPSPYQRPAQSPRPPAANQQAPQGRPGQGREQGAGQKNRPQQATPAKDGVQDRPAEGRRKPQDHVVVPRRALEDQLTRTRMQLLETERRAAVAEAVADERQRMLHQTQRNLEHATLALRALAGDPSVPRDPSNAYLVQVEASVEEKPRALESSRRALSRFIKR
ncbi:hypothetical protein ACTQ49_01120 [Luteococcus sp. Sow4_B9]|uniref:hypothetical protein n=1 Tax=Luteococcus sp. Sow4_B9 TaxID=3438792 RepID=UPI003F9DE590